MKKITEIPAVLTVPHDGTGAHIPAETPDAPWVDNDDLDQCVGCEKPLTEADIAFRYSSGEVCCSACAPTPAEQEKGRVECLNAYIELNSGPCDPDYCRNAARCWPEVGRA